MKRYINKLQSYWLADVSFATLLVMLIAVVFVLPIVMQNNNHGVLVFNILLLSVFLTGAFSTSNKWLIFISITLFSVHLILRAVRFGNNPYSYYVLENVIAIANTFLFIIINLRLLFRDQSINAYRIIGAINVYLLIALMGALVLEVIHATVGSSIAGNVNLIGSDIDYIHFIYFSLSSLTTVGFGDIYPVNVFSKMLATFLSLLGVLFPAVIIARLVGMAANTKDFK
ncbi:potassium channel family protein [Flavobacterium sp. CBA20B-1]|uniref:potassium channel family protein n=1 Tax=unclassified Flavobacterium TaxID=196869 RepID=UPI0022244918|nr:MULTISPECIES: potassium channel family protein [unclassified Flavobacterium]WCM42757.1 potassium channel family protein [Flavobacterium sp. CBA20B-1]